MMNRKLLIKSSLKTASGLTETETGKAAIRLHLPSFLSHFCGRHSSPLAVAAQRRGNAAGTHGGRRKYGKR